MATNTPAAKTTAPAAKATPETAKAAPKKSAFDFSALTVEKSETPVRSGAGRPSLPNPLMEAFKASWDERKLSRTVKGDDGTSREIHIGTGRAITVPKSEESNAVALIRRAANTLKIGSVINVDELSGGNVRIRFAAKTRKESKNK